MYIIPKKSSNINKVGFTLIELIVVVTIIAMISTIGVASYNRFNNKSVVERAANELRSNLRLAQSRAINNEKDSSACGSDFLIGWHANFSTKTIYGQCGAATFGSQSLVNLDPDSDGDAEITLSYAGDILFKTLGGTNLTSDLTTITVADNNGNYPVDVKINKSGDVY